MTSLSSYSGKTNLLIRAMVSGLYISVAIIGDTETGGSMMSVRSPMAAAEGCGRSRKRS